ncbi:SDR family NAD(P)-dependent oxidoreductase [Aeoliella sp.]|uniref:SDR family NAD(P)-dependent oxidoreductase n=1 Tax=Aeoliella sp. TaxID=2795800 RepID=UPI003CCBBEF1
MASKEKPVNVFAELISALRAAADQNIAAQSQVLESWSRYLPRVQQGGPAWLAPLRQLHQGWADAVVTLARSQQEMIDQQFDTAIKSFESVWTKPKAADASPAPAAVAQPVAQPVVEPPPSVNGSKASPTQSVEGDMNIAQRVAVVTGAAGGIGAAVAKDLAQRGARAVVMVDLNDAVNETAKAINKEVGRDVADAVVGDTSDPDFRARVFDDAASRHGMVRICVPAAGITRDALSVRVDKESGKASVYPIEDFRKVTEVNLIAPIYWAMEMLARIAEDRRRRGLKRWEPTEEMEGAVVFLGSVSSQGNKGQISYAVAKAGLEGGAATLMKEAIFHGVRCAIIHPGFTDTPMARALGDDFLNKYVLPFTQLRRLIRPEEIADAVCFMVSNSAVSGELWADAGWHPPA